MLNGHDVDGKEVPYWPDDFDPKYETMDEIACPHCFGVFDHMNFDFSLTIEQFYALRMNDAVEFSEPQTCPSCGKQFDVLLNSPQQDDKNPTWYYLTRRHKS